MKNEDQRYRGVWTIRPKPDMVDRPVRTARTVPLCTIIVVHTTVAQRQFSLHSHSSRPISHLGCGHKPLKSIAKTTAL